MSKKRMRLATWLISKRLLSPEQAQEVMAEQKKQGGSIHERFGRIAVKKGFITEAQLTKSILAKDKEEAGF